MQKKEEVITTTVILIVIAIALVGALIYWSSAYTKKIIKEVGGEDIPEAIENSKIKIKDVSIDPIHKGDMYITIENKGKLTVEKFTVTIFKDEKIYSGVFPKDVEYESGLLDLGFFQVKRFAVYFDNVDLSNYSKVEIIPFFRLEDGGLKLIEDAKEEFVRR